jgi:hypothetical protein
MVTLEFQYSSLFINFYNVYALKNSFMKWKIEAYFNGQKYS